MLAMATFLENGENPNEFVKIKEKTSMHFCFILKELVKPSHLVRSDSFSMFKKQVVKVVKDEDELYYIPNPNQYRNGKLYDWSEIEVKTKQMRNARDRKRKADEAYKKRVDNMQKRRELNEQGKLHEFEKLEKEEDKKEESSKADASMNWRCKPANEDERKKALRPVKRYQPRQRRENRYDRRY